MSSRSKKRIGAYTVLVGVAYMFEGLRTWRLHTFEYPMDMYGTKHERLAEMATADVLNAYDVGGFIVAGTFIREISGKLDD